LKHQHCISARLSDWRTILARVLNSLEFVCDILRCTIDNRIAIVKTGADESMSNKICSVSVETVSDESECFQVIVA